MLFLLFRIASGQQGAIGDVYLLAGTANASHALSGTTSSHALSGTANAAYTIAGETLSDDT